MSLENFPDEILLRIFNHCSASDILNLSTLCKKFNRLKNDKELLGKLRLVVDCGLSDEKFQQIVAFAKNKPFENLRLLHIQGEVDGTKVTKRFSAFLKTLKPTIVNLEIVNSNLNDNVFGHLIRRFLPKIVECKIENVVIDYRVEDFLDNDYGGRYQPVKLPELREPLPLRVLKLINVEGKMVKDFASCTQLDTFVYKSGLHLYRNYINPFLVRQQKLRILSLDYMLQNSRESRYFPNAISQSWNGIAFNLEELELVGAVLKDEASAREFFISQTNLTKLRLCFYNKVPNSAMQIICGLAELKTVRIDISSYMYYEPSDETDSDDFETDWETGYRDYRRRRPHNVEHVNFLVYDCYANHSAQNLIIKCDHDIKIAPDLVKVFRDVKVYHNIGKQIFNATDHKSLKDYKIDVGNPVTFTLDPQQPPSDQEAFEANVLQFVRNNVNKIRSAFIGQESWLGFVNFTFSPEFNQKMTELLHGKTMKLYDRLMFDKSRATSSKAKAKKRPKGDKDGEPPKKLAKLEKC